MVNGEYEIKIYRIELLIKVVNLLQYYRIEDPSINLAHFRVGQHQFYF